jgi:hypothetical protein
MTDDFPVAIYHNPTCGTPRNTYASFYVWLLPVQ